MKLYLVDRLSSSWLKHVGNKTNCQQYLHTTYSNVFSLIEHDTVESIICEFHSCLLYHTHSNQFNVWIDTLRPSKNGRYFAEYMFKCIFVNESVWISIMIRLKFVSNVPINNILALVQIMGWCRPGDKPLSKPMMVWLPTHICITRPQGAKVWNEIYRAK